MRVDADPNGVALLHRPIGTPAQDFRIRMQGLALLVEPLDEIRRRGVRVLAVRTNEHLEPFEAGPEATVSRHERANRMHCKRAVFDFGADDRCADGA